MNNIYIDFDETLTNSISSILYILNKQYGTNVKAEEVKSWDFTDCFPNLKVEELENLFSSDDFFKHLTWKPYMKSLLYLTSKYNITIVTKGDKINLQKKQQWLKEQGFEHINFIGLDLQISKGMIDMSDGIFIDDNQWNLQESNAKYKLLFENYTNCEWNNEWKGDRICIQ